MESDLERIYYIKHEDEDIFMQPVDMLRVPFKEILSTMTLPATALEAHEWKAWWLEKYR